jgi:HD-GYP domain-containing protein (c-di-GMP phosphodiesterase class II)
MLKRIDVSDLELGMFVHKLEGSWFKHPFWWARFALQDEWTLHKLQSSDLPAVIIDTDRGLELRPVTRNTRSANPGAAPERPKLRSPAVIARRTRRNVEQPATAQFDLRSTAPQSLPREFGHASRVADKSRKVISRVFLEARLGKSIKASVIEPVIENIFASVQRNTHAFNGLMRCKRDNEFLYRHALAVSALMISLGRQMKLRPDDLRAAGMAGLLIDVGVGHLPVDLAACNGDFRRIDARVFQEHARLGYNCLLAGGIAPAVALASLEHHERFDGAGYPQGLVGDATSLIGRMAAICDAYDWLVDDGASGPGIDPAAALQQLATDRGAFDLTVLASFADAMGIYPIGAVVLLESARLAMVVGQDAAEPTRPRVRTFFSASECRPVPQVEIALADCYGEDRIVGTADPLAYGCADFPRLRERLFVAACAGR